MEKKTRVKEKDDQKIMCTACRKHPYLSKEVKEKREKKQAQNEKQNKPSQARQSKAHIMYEESKVYRKNLWTKQRKYLTKKIAAHYEKWDNELSYIEWGVNEGKWLNTCAL